MKGMKGTVVGVKPHLVGGRLRVIASVRMEEGRLIEAHMPDREVAAILPRSILLGAGNSAPLSMLDTVEPILARMTEGREVRIWQYKERWFFSFQPWKGVKFVDGREPDHADLPDRPGGQSVMPCAHQDPERN